MHAFKEMASIENHAATNSPPSPTKSYHQRSRSNNVLKSFMQRRNTADAEFQAPEPLVISVSRPDSMIQDELVMAHPNTSRPTALGEIQQNQVGGAPRSPTKETERLPTVRSPRKNIFNTVVPKSPTKNACKLGGDPDSLSPVKPKKTKSATNLVGLLSRPKSAKSLPKLFGDDEVHSKKDKENQTPLEPPRMPIYAQFSSGALERQKALNALTGNDGNDDVFGRTYTNTSNNVPSTHKPKIRPKSYHASSSTFQELKQSSTDSKHSSDSSKSSPSKLTRGLKVFSSGGGSKDKSPVTPDMSEFVVDPKDIDKHLEAMLDRRNIPEHQRYKMRNLADTIKMEFIRQDWAENRGITNLRPDSHGSDSSIFGPPEQQEDKSKDKDSEKDKDKDAKVKRTRGRTFTLSRNSAKKSESRSPKKQKGEGSIGRHFRSRSTDSVVSERPISAGSGSGSGILSKMKLQQGPGDYVSYLRKVQKPESVEVGKLHKLRLLLRNETVAWTEEFIRQGGMQEIVGLLHRIMDVEWREEHEDALLHENLLCLKALCTTALALQYLHSIQATLFPALLHMIFDPEKKGPSEFTTRNIITSVLFTYIQSAPPQDRPVRARTILNHLRDPEPEETKRPVDFVMGMRRERPYRVWCKEATSVTKEVFWIFLHHLNVVHLPQSKEPKDGTAPSTNANSNTTAAAADSLTYMQAHFPQERPPVPAAPYVGGVEWDATNYLASHLDLLNAIIACTPTAEERNALRGLMRISGWERCMGASLRLCKEKFYPCVHDGLRTWVAAAVEDGWDARDVRYGPPPEPRSPAKRPANGGGGGGGGANKAKPKEEQAAPRIEIPKLDFGLPHGPTSPAVRATCDNWLS
ncbi:armadillo-type protein [Biscogniauxia mediterranea]|nr:armadillo-type protein [Biscogniauxia mediterranea]